MLETLLTLSIIAILFLGAFLLIGRLVFNFYYLIEKQAYRTFAHLAIGVLLTTLVFSLIRSGGKTILVLQIPVLIFILGYTRKASLRFKFEMKEFVSDWLLGVISFLPIFVFSAWFYFDWTNGSFKSLFIDAYYYADFTNSLKLFGSESKFYEMNYFFSENRNMLVPYHYPELWLTAFVSFFSGISHVSSYSLVVTPLLISISFIGIMSLFEGIIGVNAIKAYLIGFFCLFFSGLYLKYYENGIFLDYYHWSESSLLCRATPKVAFVYIFLFLAFKLLWEEKFLYAMLVLCLIPSFSITFIPGIGGVFVVVLLWAWWNHGKWLWLDGLKLGSLFAFVMLGLAVFYSVFESGYTSGYAMKSSFVGKVLKQDFSFLDIKIFLGNCIYRLGAITLFNLPYLLLISLVVRKIFLLLLSVMVGLVAGVVASSLFYPVMDSSQFGSSQMILVSILAMFSLSVILSQIKTFSKALLGIAFCVVLGSVSYSTITFIDKKNEYRNDFSNDLEFMQSIRSTLKNDPEVIMVYLGDRDYQKIFFPNWNVVNSIMNLVQYTNQSLLFTLGNPERFFEVKANPTEEEFYYYNQINPLYVWKLKNPNMNTADFVRVHKIRSVYCKAGVERPVFVNEGNWTEIRSKATGDVFYSLN